MKNLFLIFSLVFGTLSFAQNTERENTETLKITQKKCIPRKGYHLVLKEVLSDSRCPEGVNCIWAGEIQMVISAYKDKVLIEDSIITISLEHKQENVDWLSKYLPSNQQNIISIGAFPYPKEGKVIKLKNIYIKIEYLK